jgi:glycerophosphoryl diester phosphodiesterase
VIGLVPGLVPGLVTELADGRRPLRLAHRGDFRVAPENTLPALEAAMRIPGCDGVEFDVRLSRDGIPVLLHDPTLARVQHLRQRVDRLDGAELAVHGIPRLDDVLAALPRAWMDIELKGDGHGEVTAAVLLAARGEEPATAVVSSFEPATLLAMREQLPGWTRWLNAEDLSQETLSLAVDLGCRAVSVLDRAITPSSVARARDAGLEVAAWTVRYRATFERMAQLGVVACCVEAAALDG